MSLQATFRSPYNARVQTDPPTGYSTYNPSLDNLRSLLIIRSIALLGQAGVLGYVMLASRTTENPWGVTLSLLAMALITGFSLWRTTRSIAVTDGEFFAQLLIDVLGWTALMYFSGGANNPFVSYYIVPLVISAAVLPWRYTWLVAGSSLLAYSLLLYYYQPFPLFTPHAHMGHDSQANIHVLGMWFNFLFSAGLITYFVVRMAATLRQQEVQAVRQREDRLRNDQIMAVASLAAGTAHELGTPLSTMTVLVDEMLADQSLPADARKDCELLRSQLEQCRSTLRDLSRTAELKSTEQRRQLPLSKFVRLHVERWVVRRPGVLYDIAEVPPTGGQPMPNVEFDSTLVQAFENLLNNAADSGSSRIAISYRWNEHECRVSVRDWGGGFAPELLQDIGKPIIRASRSGLGIGLLLSHATVERYGGRIELCNLKDGGAEATLYLPIQQKESTH